MLLHQRHERHAEEQCTVSGSSDLAFWWITFLLAILNEKKIVDENLCTMSFATFPNSSVYQKHAKNDQCRVRTGDLFGVNETR